MCDGVSRCPNPHQGSLAAAVGRSVVQRHAWSRAGDLRSGDVARSGDRPQPAVEPWCKGMRGAARETFGRAVRLGQETGRNSRRGTLPCEDSVSRLSGCPKVTSSIRSRRCRCRHIRSRRSSAKAVEPPGQARWRDVGIARSCPGRIRTTEDGCTANV